MNISRWVYQLPPIIRQFDCADEIDAWWHNIMPDIFIRILNKRNYEVYKPKSVTVMGLKSKLGKITI